MTPDEKAKQFIQQYIHGSTDRESLYKVLFAGKHVAVILRKGHTWYSNCVSPSEYVPAEVILAEYEKALTDDYGNNVIKTLHEGKNRLTKKIKLACVEEGKQADANYQDQAKKKKKEKNDAAASKQSAKHQAEQWIKDFCKQARLYIPSLYTCGIGDSAEVVGELTKFEARVSEPGESLLGSKKATRRIKITKPFFGEPYAEMSLSHDATGKGLTKDISTVRGILLGDKLTPGALIDWFSTAGSQFSL